MSGNAVGFRALLVVLAIAAFVVRAYEPLSKPHLWATRSQRFASAIASGDWRHTYQHYHPAVTTMVVGALALKAHEAMEGSAGERLFRWAVPSHATRYGHEIAAGVLGMAVVEVLLLVAIVLVCRRLAGEGFALAAGGLLAFSPPVLAENRGFHPDALLGLLMMLSALLLLLALLERRPRLVAASGVVGGLALLTKTASLFLFPYTALSLFVFSWPMLRGSWAGPVEGRPRRLAIAIWQSMAKPGFVWSLAAAAPFALWPAMWADPLRVLRGLHYGVRTAAFRPHEKLMFFLGELYPGTAPLMFYPVALAFRSTFVTLTLAVAAVLLYAGHRKQERSTPAPVIFWMIVAYVFFFTLQMAIASKQAGTRYVHPAQLGLEIVAASGVATLAELTRRRISHPRSAMFAGRGLVLLVIGLQAVVALPYAPDYGAHHNLLLGGNPVAVGMIPIANRNEGLISLTRELRRLPDVSSATIAASGAETSALKQYFDGSVSDGISAETDYYLFDRASLQRYMNPHEWEAAWNEVRGRRPAIVVFIDRVEFLWLYRARGEPDETIEIRRGWEGMGIVPLAWAAMIGALLAWVVSPLSWRRSSPPPAAPPQELRGA
jgi:Dolichyl-phosphate-mannose-protein mannosyltransferase